MEIPDPFAITAISTIVGTLGGAIAVLWGRSEKCLSDREVQAARIDKLEAEIYGCPVPVCPHRPKWDPPSEATTNAPRIPILPRGLPPSPT